MLVTLMFEQFGVLFTVQVKYIEVQIDPMRLM